MNKFILKRDHPDGNNFEIDVTDCSFIEVVDILREKSKLGGIMHIINDGLRLIVDNKRFLGV